MKNTKNNVLDILANTQDGKLRSLTKGNPDRFDAFIGAVIDHNTLTLGPHHITNVEDVISDFNYMIHELSRAKAELEKQFSEG